MRYWMIVTALLLTGMVQQSPSLEPVPTVSSGYYTYYAYHTADGDFIEQLDIAIEMDGDMIVMDDLGGQRLHGLINSSGYVFLPALYMKVIDRDTMAGFIDAVPPVGIIIRPKR